MTKSVIMPGEAKRCHICLVHTVAPAQCICPKLLSSLTQCYTRDCAGNKQAVVVYRLPNGDVYCTDANSTAFEFPLSNANIITDGAGCLLLRL